MELCAFVEPQQGASYEQLLAMARVAQETGSAGFFRSDHLLAMGGADGLPGPSEAWATLAGLARDTSGIRLGTLVSPVTFRLPGPLAVTVAGIDAMSGGRIELGLGAGWYEDEHRALGISFPPVGERFERLEEQLEILTGLWACPPGESFSYAGRHYELAGNPALPRPAQRPHPPIVLGGSGRRRIPSLAARFADEYNASFLSPERAAEQFVLVRRACEQAGRDPASIRLSAAVVACCGADDAEVARRAAAIGPRVEQPAAARGTPAKVAEQLAAYQRAGAVRLYLQLLDLEDLDHLRLIAAEVAPLLG